MRAIDEAIGLLDSGRARVAEKKGDDWVVNEWLKKAVLLQFRTQDNKPIDAGYTRFYDKVPMKFGNASDQQLRESGVRVVPHAIARRGAYIAPNTVLMPSYVNVGAYVDSGTMVPLDERHTVLDWMIALHIPAVLVAGSYLGTISHTLSALDVLRRYDVGVRCIVVSETPGSPVRLDETVSAIARFAKPVEVIALPRLKSATDPHPAFARIASLL